MFASLHLQSCLTTFVSAHSEKIWAAIPKRLCRGENTQRTCTQSTNDSPRWCSLWQPTSENGLQEDQPQKWSWQTPSTSQKTLQAKCVARMKLHDRMKYVSLSTVAHLVFSHFRYRHSLCLEPAMPMTSYLTGKKLKYKIRLSRFLQVNTDKVSIAAAALAMWGAWIKSISFQACETGSLASCSNTFVTERSNKW